MEYLIVNCKNMEQIAVSVGGMPIMEPEYIPVSEECLEDVEERILAQYEDASIIKVGIRTIRSFDYDVDGTFMCIYIG